MEIRCRCTGCSAKFKVEAKYAGKKARCPKCQAVVDVPLTSGDETVNVTPASPNVGPTPSTPAPTLPISSPLSAPKPGTTTAAIPVLKKSPQPAAAASPLPAVGNNSTQVGATGSTIPSFNPTSVPAPATAAEFPAFSTTPTGSATATPAKSAANQPRGRKNSSSLPLLLGGGGLVLAVAAAVGVYLASSGGTAGRGDKKGGSANVAASKDATLHLDWPQDQRSGGSLVIDGQRRSIPAAGALKFTLPPGEHRIVMLRRGFEPFDKSVSLTKGQEEHLAPQWTVSTVAAIPTPAVNLPAAAPDPAAPMPAVGSADFPIGTAVQTSSVKGFEGWHQMLEQAKRQAAQSKKDLLILFGCSDAQRATQELARELDLAGVKQSHVCVMIDFPRTTAGLDVLADRVQNELLLEEFGVKSLPTLALADEQGRTFFLKREWDGGFGGLATKLAEWSQEKGQRDALLAAARQGTEQEQLAAAAKVVKWIQDKAVWRSYATEIGQWMTAAQRVDPDNKQAVLEVFFEPQWFIDVVQVNDEDAAAVARVAAQLDPWVARKFQDPDRGAKLHMTAGFMLAQVERFDEATVQIEHAIKYKPKNSKLADDIEEVKRRLAFKDLLGIGTGFLISSSGYVLTNHHVIDGDGRIEVSLPGQADAVPAEVIAQDEDRDIALLKITPPAPDKCRPLPVAAGDIGRGDPVAAFGFPLSTTLGSGLKFTQGVVSALPDPTNNGQILLDLRVNPGNSGGPLCDSHGNVVGMIARKTGNTDLEDSYAMAIPTAELIKFLDQHLPQGTPRAAPPAPAQPLTWGQVDRLVNTGVLMILNKKK